jgi:hypothetical protein
MLLVIKGTRQDAETALAARNIPADYVGPRPNITGDENGRDFAMVTFRTDDTNGDQVSAWFTSDGAPPYPPGSLLHYQWEHGFPA